MKSIEFIAATAIHSTIVLTPTANFTQCCTHSVVAENANHHSIPCLAAFLYFLPFMILHVECHVFTASDLSVLSYLSKKLCQSNDADLNKIVLKTVKKEQANSSQDTR